MYILQSHAEFVSINNVIIAHTQIKLIDNFLHYNLWWVKKSDSNILITVSYFYSDYISLHAHLNMSPVVNSACQVVQSLRGTSCEPAHGGFSSEAEKEICELIHGPIRTLCVSILAYHSAKSSGSIDFMAKLGPFQIFFPRWDLKFEMLPCCRWVFFVKRQGSLNFEWRWLVSRVTRVTSGHQRHESHFCMVSGPKYVHFACLMFFCKIWILLNSHAVCWCCCSCHCRCCLLVVGPRMEKHTRTHTHTQLQRILASSR